MNILDDTTYGKKYSFHIGDLLGNILFTLKLNDINPNEISIDLIEKYMCILAEKYMEKGIKAEFILTKEEIQKFINNNSSLYKQNPKDEKKILILKEITPTNLAKVHHSSMPFKILNVVVNGEVQSKLIEAYNNEIKPKVLEKKTNN